MVVMSYLSPGDGWSSLQNTLPVTAGLHAAVGAALERAHCLDPPFAHGDLRPPNILCRE